MKKFIIIGIVIFILLGLGMYYGLVPAGSLLNSTKTKSFIHGEFQGMKTGEMLQPHDKTGFIMSWKGDGHSETISVRGKITTPSGGDTSWWLAPSKYYYRVYLKENAFSSYERVSHPGDTKKMISNPNPGHLKFSSTSLEPYDFTIIGDDYNGGAVKAELWAYIDLSPWDTTGYDWYLMARDEAYLYDGYSSLTLPRGIVDGEDRPFSTFEVGQEVKIRVETAKGGYDETGKPWRVTLNEPYGGSIEDPGDGGGVIKEQSYENDALGYFTFTVTEEMALKSMQSSEPYTIRIWNVLLPRGSLYVDFVDFIARSPDNVVFSGGDTQCKVGDTYSINLDSESAVGVDYIRVSVIYATNDVLLPSDPTSPLWLINTKNLGGDDSNIVSLPQTLSFIADRESYVTIHAKAFDIDGRGSPSTSTFTIWFYQSSQVPDEVVEGEVGDDYYGGGKTPGYTPWTPSGGNWENAELPMDVDWTGVLIGVLIVAGMALVGFYVFKQPRMIMVMILAGVIIAVLQYVVFFTDMIL